MKRKRGIDYDKESEDAPRLERVFVEERFKALKAYLLEEALKDTETVSVRHRLKQTANEAAGLAWTTDYPLLVFPALFAEMARRERLNSGRQQRIRARTEMLLTAV